MNLTRVSALPLAPAALLLALGACQSEAGQQADQLEDEIEAQAEASAVGGGDAVAALGLTEAHLIDADLVSPDGKELGDVKQVRRNADGVADALVVELEDSDPDRFVELPLDGLSARISGGDTQVETEMTADELAALPDVQTAVDAPADAPATPAV